MDSSSGRDPLKIDGARRQPPQEERLFGGRFQARQRLKDDSAIATLLGTDLEQGGEVIIKTATAADVPAGIQLRLQHEAEVLGAVRSPHLTPLLGMGREDGLLYLTMPYVPGITLRERLDEGPLEPRDALTVAIAMMEALAEAHSKGVLHRDVKPANVIVDPRTPLRSVTLIDFGLARSVRLGASIRDLPAGTANYISPEQAGLVHQEVDERADLYSAGAVMYECLTASPPFQGLTVGEVLRQHVTAPPPDPRHDGANVPRALASVVQRLLQKDPRDRYQSADAAIADLTEIAAALDRGESDPDVVIGARDRRRTLTEPALVGRERELAGLIDALARAREGEGGLALVEAESGGGKTRLLEELARRGTESGAWVLSGQGSDQVAQSPFQVLEGVVSELVAAAIAEPVIGERLRLRLAGREAAVVAALPALGPVLGVGEDNTLGPEDRAEARTVAALAMLLDVLGSVSRPALVMLDDCQWCDELTIELVRQWFERSRASSESHHVLLVIAFRSDEVESDHPLRALEPSLRTELPTLTEEEVQKLLESMAGPLPEEAVALVTRLCDGSPFMAAELLRGLVESGALAHDGARWRADREGMADAQSSRRAGALLARRLDSLAPHTLELLSVGAVLGKSFDLAFAGALTEQAAADTRAAVQEARTRHIVLADADGARYTFVHDRLREALLDRLEEGERRSLHRRAALRLESTDPERVFELAYHFDAGDASERALPYALAAAEDARSRHTLEVAEQQCRIASRAGRHADDATRGRIEELLGDVLMLRGRYDEAAEHLTDALSLATEPQARAQIEGTLGELAFKHGDVRKARERIERALRSLGQRVPRTRVSFALALGWEVIVQVLHTLAPRVFLGRRSPSRARDELLAIRLYSRLAYVYWFQCGLVPCGFAHLREMNLAERYTPTPELAQAYSEHAPVATMIPAFRRGIAYAERSLAIRRQLGDVWGEGQSLSFYGIVLYAASRFEESIDKLRDAVAILERTGDPWEASTATWHIAFSQYRLGNLSEAVATSRRAHQTALRLGDHQVAAISLGAWAKASCGQVPAELVNAELDRSGDDVHAFAEALQAEGLRLLASGDPAAAVTVLERARKRVREAGLRQEYVAPVLPWLTTALRCQAEAAPLWAPRQRRSLLRRARRTARSAERLAKSYRNNLPHALRERALLEALAGRDRKARSLLDRSLAIAERQGARYESAQTLLARGELAVALGRGGDGDIATARRALDDLGAHAWLGPAMKREPSLLEPSEPGDPQTLSLLDRFSTVVETGREIATALSREAVIDAVRASGVTLLRAERCLVLEVAPDGEVRPAMAADGGQHSSAVISRAIAQGRPVVLDGGLRADPSESVTISRVRSVLCAPIYVRGRVAACLYATHANVGGLFDADEEQIAQFIAALAGAALENAEGFADVQALSRSLETRAAELERSNYDLQQFAHAASHDLSEPLRMVSSYLQLLSKRYRGRLDAEADEFIGYAVEGAARMQALINGLLVYSSAGTAEYAIGPVNCNEVVDESLQALEARIQESGAEVVVGELPVIRADETQLKQLFQNLLSNALKFVARHGKPRVSVSAERQPGGWRFSVEDNGIGIEPRHAERIFTVFQRLHGRDAYPGSGIGLAICKRIVERHGGQIWVEQVPEGGSRFCFTFADEKTPSFA